MRRITSLLLVLMLMVSCLPASVYATQMGDSSTQELNPALIVEEISDYSSNTSEETLDNDYQFIEDVHMGIGDHTISEGEPNDFDSQATKLYHDYTVSGTLSSKDLIDGFKFTVTSRSEVMIVAVAKYKSLMMGIWNSADKIVAASGKGSLTSGGRYGFDIVETLNAGTYYFRILDGDGLYNSYTFYITIDPVTAVCTHVNYTSHVTNPSCTEQGYTTYVCMGCEHQWTDDYTLATGHNWGGWSVSKPADCMEKGEECRECISCGQFEFRDIKQISHTEVYDPAVPATCAEEGKLEGSHCSACGIILKEQVIVPATGIHTYSSNQDTTCNVCGYVRQFSNVESVPMYRMYDPNSSEHFYTGSVEERDGLVTAGWNYEGVGFNFPVAGSPVHRLYHKPTGEHLYTMNEQEKAQLLASGWNYEGVAFNSAGIDEVPQYRLHNPNATRGAYHFTGSTEERDYLISIGWEYQGIGWYSCIK